MATGDFAQKLGVVLKAINLSRGRLAQTVGVDKSVVSRWASGVQVPSDHNLSLLTEAVARHRPGFERRDWDLDAEGFANRFDALDAGASSLEGPSIAVLPFENMSGDPEQEYFADGMVEDIITALSRFKSLFVIARNSTFTYKGKAIDVRQVGRELGVRYVLEGSVRRSGKRIRVTAQLIDTSNSAHLWAERYDRVVEDVFDVQEEITRSIVAAVAPEIQNAEIAGMRRSRPGNFRAYEIAMRSWSEATAADAAGNREKCNHALALADEALQKDPACVLALVAKAFAHFQHAFYGTCELEKSLELAREAATAATRIDHLDHRAHAYMAMGHLAAGDFDGALAEARYAHDLNPNDVLALRTLGWVEAASGETAAASEHLHQALRLNPRDPFRFEIHTVLGIACFMDEDYAKGVEWGLLSVSENPSYPGTLITLAQNLVGMGDIKRAQGHIATLKSVAPDWLTKRLAGASGYKRPRDRERQVRFLRIATGLESTE